MCRKSSTNPSGAVNTLTSMFFIAVPNITTTTHMSTTILSSSLLLFTITMTIS